MSEKNNTNLEPTDIIEDQPTDIIEDPRLLAAQTSLLLCGMIIYWGDGTVTESELGYLKTILSGDEFSKIIDIIDLKDPLDKELCTDEIILWLLETTKHMKIKSEELKLKGKKLENSIIKNLSVELRKYIKYVVEDEFKGYFKRRSERKIVTATFIGHLRSLAKIDDRFSWRERKIIKLVRKNTKVPKIFG